jgi:hypothetical protein
VSIELCKHDLPAGQCDYCKPKSPPDPFSAPAERPPSVFTAAYDGECGNCDGAIYVGDQIARQAEQDYVHADCLED